MRLPLLAFQLPTHVINGLSVTLGVALVQGLVYALAGSAAAFTACSGAVLASLADVPNVPSRTWRRVLSAALMGSCTAGLVMSLRTDANALGLAILGLGFVSGLVLVWGPRAMAISFVPVLALVFTLALPPADDVSGLWLHLAWTFGGSLLYLAWAMASAWGLRRRYRTLALTQALAALADLLKSRSERLRAPSTDVDTAASPQDWLRRQLTLDERLQAARDMLFVARPGPGARQQQALLLWAIDVRDTLLASELDLHLLGEDEAALTLRHALAERIEAVAAGLSALAEALRLPQHPTPPVESAQAALPAGLFAQDASRLRLALAAWRRTQHMQDDLQRMRQALANPVGVQLPLQPQELLQFVSPEGWPLSALRGHTRLGSPVLRHALRTSLALCCAYFIAIELPWASHPHWLVLSVAVVLRGNLEQTLARRDARVLGTALGCLLVLGMALLASDWLSRLCFLLAVGIGHAYLTRRYLITAAAATVMALLQAHLVAPEGGFAVSERLADTVLGAGLAWAFSYVLPWWERRGMPGLLDRALRGLSALAEASLRWPEPGASALPLRLARREVFDAMGSIASSAQRTHVEPESVRLPLFALATLLMRSHLLLAQLAATRILLRRRAADLDSPATRQALEDTRQQLMALLHLQSAAAPEAILLKDSDDPLPELPSEQQDLRPWLQRRLDLTLDAAARVAQAARALRAYAR